MTRGLEDISPAYAWPAYRSEGERRIAAVLDQYGIPFVYEQPLKLRLRHRTTVFRPDFYLPQSDVYVEYYGRAGNAEYDARTLYKERLYRANQVRCVGVYPWDLCQGWPEKFIGKLEQTATAYRSKSCTPGYQAGALRPRGQYRSGVSRYRGHRR